MNKDIFKKRKKKKQEENLDSPPTPSQEGVVSSSVVKHIPSNIKTSLILSGVEGDRYWDIVVNKGGFKTVLMSYHYLKAKPKDFLRKRLASTPDVKVFVDSGAYTFISNFDKYQNESEDFWKDYLEEYTTWIKDNADLVFACADLDIDDLVGIEKVDEWRAKYFEPLRQKGIDVCYIWHEIRGMEGWKSMCAKYDYVGMSTENDSINLQLMTKMLNISKKYNTRVHGMALTKTELLVRVPLFSADSTTWLVGQQYGELNWFDGRKMKRLDKSTWQTTYKTRLLREPFNADWDALINGMGGRGDTYELLRLNVIAYKLAEEYVRKRLGSKMYWFNPSNSSPDDWELPPRDWFEGDNHKDFSIWLEKLGIKVTDISEDEGVQILKGFFTYLNEDEDYLAEVDNENMFEFCKEVLNEAVDDRNRAIELIKQYHMDNLTGKRKDFFQEEIENPWAKEREKYIEDDEFIVYDVSKEELNKLLPSPEGDMPEVEAYDEELQKMSITPVRDNKGRFLKGQKAVRKPKNIYSDKLPKLSCDTCYKAGDCPEYKPGFVCAFNKVFKQFETRSTEDVVDAMHSMVNSNLGRLQRAMMFETMDGGMITPEVSALIDQNMKLLNVIKDMSTPRTLVSQRRILKGDGTEETVTELNMNPSQGGILSQIFGSNESKSREDEKPKKPKSKEPVEVEVIDADYEETDRPKKKKIKKRLKKKK